MNVDRDAVVEVFRAESDEALTQVEGCLVQLERDPRNQELVYAVFRAMHTLKGDAMSLGFGWLSEYAHGLEDVLEAVRGGRLEVTPALINLLLRAVDALRVIVPEAIAGVETRCTEHQSLLGALLEQRRAPEIRDDAIPAAARDPSEHEIDPVQSLRVDLPKLDRILTLNGEIAIARGRTRLLLDEHRERLPKELLELHAEADRLFLDLQELVLKTRMLPVAPIFSRFERTARDSARLLDKLVRLEVRADGVELDAAVVERMRGALGHMIRNAVAHGIEPPAERAARGKDPCGTIKLEARQVGSSVVIDVQDDGAGLDRKKIAERGRRLGLAQPERLDNSELFELIFAPGFSTASSVTEVSGRGVGMDIVRRGVDALRGTVLIESSEGVGTKFSIKLPLTLAVIEGLLLEVAQERYVLPLSTVIDCVDFRDESQRASASGLAEVRDETVPYVRLRKFFGTDESRPARENLVVVRQGSDKLGLVVDALLGEAQTVVKPLGRLFQDVPGVGGSAILGNGRVALILDVPSLFRQAAGAHAV